MFIRVFEPAENAERIGEGSRALLVRLRHIDDCRNTWVNASDGRGEVFPPFLVSDEQAPARITSPDVISDDGVTGVLPFLRWGAGNDDVVERAAEVVYEVPEYDSHHGVRLLREHELVTPDLTMSLRWGNADNVVRLGLGVGAGHHAEIRHVLLSPLDFEPPGLSQEDESR